MQSDCDTVVVGGGVAGLQLALRLLHAGKKVVVVESSDRVGGRIRDVDFGEGIEIAGLGAWRYNANDNKVEALVKHYGIATGSWANPTRQYAARNVVKPSVRAIRQSVFPSIGEDHPLASLPEDEVDKRAREIVAQSFLSFSPNEHAGDPPTGGTPPVMSTIVEDAFGTETEQFLSSVSHSYHAISGLPVDFVSLIRSANPEEDHPSRPVRGMNALVEAMANDVTARSTVRLNSEVVGVRRSDGDDKGGRKYTLTLAGPGATGESGHRITADSVALAIPSSSLRRLATASSLLRPLAENALLSASYGMPAFKAVALYPSAWWSAAAVASDGDDERRNLQDREFLVTSFSKLGLVMPYAGRGPRGEAALHLAYCNDHHAAQGGHWARLVERARGDREEIYASVESELQALFPTADIPRPIRFEYVLWADGSIHVPCLVPGAERGLSRKVLEDWAVGGPLPGEQIVLAGEAFANRWGWVEGALETADRAADVLVGMSE